MVRNICNIFHPIQAFDVAEEQLGITPVMTGQEMEECEKVDQLVMVTYISQVRDRVREKEYRVRISVSLFVLY